MKSAEEVKDILFKSKSLLDFLGATSIKYLTYRPNSFDDGELVVHRVTVRYVTPTTTLPHERYDLYVNDDMQLLDRTTYGRFLVKERFTINPNYNFSN